MLKITEINQDIVTEAEEIKKRHGIAVVNSFR